MIFQVHANKTLFHKKGCALGLVFENDGFWVSEVAYYKVQNVDRSKKKMLSFTILKAAYKALGVKQSPCTQCQFWPLLYRVLIPTSCFFLHGPTQFHIGVTLPAR